jgi:putative phosphoesterase
MRVVFLSDIHGVASKLEAALAKADAIGFDKIVLLGDLLYHGPRNGVPDLYDPVKVSEMLNARASDIIAVRGNCDAEVDQMMVKFPIMDDYKVIDVGNKKLFLTHGHLWNEFKVPPIGMADVLVHGHTHIPEYKNLECGLVVFNPGSVSLPKGDSDYSIGYYDGVEFKHYSFLNNQK